MVDDRVLPGGVEIHRLIHQAVEIGLAVARLDREGHGRLPPRGEQLRDIRLFERGEEFALVVPQHGHRGGVRLGVAVYKIAARGR